MLSLRELQLRFSAALAPDRDGTAAPADPALLALIEARGALGPAARLGIYADMYRARLVDVLREDFPRVLAIVGDEGFHALACRYLARHPSLDPSVRHVGRDFAGFLASERIASGRRPARRPRTRCASSPSQPWCASGARRGA